MVWGDFGELSHHIKSIKIVFVLCFRECVTKWGSSSITARRLFWMNFLSSEACLQVCFGSRFTNFKTQGIRVAEGKSNPHDVETDFNICGPGWPWFLFCVGLTSPRVQANAHLTDRKLCTFRPPSMRQWSSVCVLNRNNACATIGQIQPFSQNTYNTIIFLQWDGAQWFVLPPSCVCWTRGAWLHWSKTKNRKRKTTCL